VRRANPCGFPSQPADIESWLVCHGPSAPEVGDFIDWAADRQLIGRLVIPGRVRRQVTPLDDDTRWALVDRLLHDEDFDLGDRVAGCLVLPYGQQLSRIVTLTREQVTSREGIVRLRLGRTEIQVPEPLGEMLTRLATHGRPRPGLTSPRDGAWLFTGLHPGRPLSASQLGARLRRLGIGTMKGRRGAMMHLARQLPASVLADLLNLHATTACRWVDAAGGDWNNYAAEIARRGNREL